MKKNYIRQLFVAMSMLLCSVVISAYDFDVIEVDGIMYSQTSDTTVAIVSIGNNKYSGNFVIPETINYNDKSYTVTSIGQVLFSGCTGLTSVTIPNSVTSIGDCAFQNCTGLTSVTIPNSVTRLGYGAFYGCTGLTSITIPESVTAIEGATFSGCTGLTSVTIPNSATSIGAYAFDDCVGLTSVTIPNSVTSIGGYAFENCISLTSIAIPNSVTSIGLWAFYGCTNLDAVYINSIAAWCNIEHNSWSNPLNYAQNLYLNGELVTSVTIPEGVNEIKNEVFVGYKKLTAITIPNSVTSIGNYAFQNCTGLTSIVIPESVKSIGDYAFNGCTNLANIAIGNSIESIGNGAFNATAWEKNLPEGLLYFGNSLYKYVGTMPDSTSLEIKDGTTTICDNAFSGCTSLTSVKIPESVTSIGYYAFKNCENLSDVYIENLTAWLKIDNYSNPLIYAENLYLNGELVTDVVIPEDVTEIKSNVFYGYGKLVSVTTHNGITSIGDYAFRNCSGLTSIEIPNSVTSIGRYAFSWCRGLTSITIPESVTSIGDYVFLGCSGLISVTIPKSVTSIGFNAFSNTFIRMIKVLNDSPDRIKINSSAFADINYRDKVLLCVPAGSKDAYNNNQDWCSWFDYIAEYDDNAVESEFSDINWKLDLQTKTLTLLGEGELSDDPWGGLVEYIDNIVIDDNIDVMSKKPFEGTNWYKNLPEGLVYIGKSLLGFKNSAAITDTVVNIKEGTVRITESAFSNDTIIKKVNVPGTLKYIDKKAFHNCDSLISIDINNVKTIDEKAFSNCSALASIAMENVETIGKEAFRACTMLSGELNLKNLKSLGESAFYDCRSLERVTDLGEITEIPSSAFCRATGLKECNIPRTVKNIGENAFERAGFEKVIIPQNVDYIANKGYYGHSALDTVIIASEKIKLGDNVFASCNSIKAVYILSDTIPEFNNESQRYIAFNTGIRVRPRGTLYVPIGCKNKYPEVFTKNFDAVVEMDMTELRKTTGIAAPADDECLASVAVANGKIAINGCNADETICIYSMDGRLVKEVAGDAEIVLDKGIYIVCIGDKAVKVRL